MVKTSILEGRIPAFPLPHCKSATFSSHVLYSEAKEADVQKQLVRSTSPYTLYTFTDLQLRVSADMDGESLDSLSARFLPNKALPNNVAEKYHQIKAEQSHAGSISIVGHEGDYCLLVLQDVLHGHRPELAATLGVCNPLFFPSNSRTFDITAATAQGFFHEGHLIICHADLLPISRPWKNIPLSGAKSMNQVTITTESSKTDLKQISAVFNSVISGLRQETTDAEGLDDAARDWVTKKSNELMKKLKKELLKAQASQGKADQQPRWVLDPTQSLAIILNDIPPYLAPLYPRIQSHSDELLTSCGFVEHTTTMYGHWFHINITFPRDATDSNSADPSFTFNPNAVVWGPLIIAGSDKKTPPLASKETQTESAPPHVADPPVASSSSSSSTSAPLLPPYEPKSDPVTPPRPRSGWSFGRSPVKDVERGTGRAPLSDEKH